ncbi:MAG: iron dicitrate transport regulator FecR [Verrucomicrobiaceae bacterium]|nr:iron dicitrate transport regulator FecR [Verrucomicrobiaceae bacterium]
MNARGHTSLSYHMKTRFSLPLLMLVSVQALNGAPLRQAQFTRIMNDVQVVPEQKSPLPAKLGDSVFGKTAVTTGVQSRAELKFLDNSLTRLGANSVFSLEEGSRTVDLKQGTILLQVPKQMGGAHVRTAAITAVVTGTTVLIEYRPDGVAKFIVLEGQMDVLRNDKPSVFTTLKAGDMLSMKTTDKTFPEKVQVDLKRLKETSLLISDKIFGALGNQKFLKEAVDEQSAKIKNGELQATSLAAKNHVEFIDINKRIDLVPKFIAPPPVPVVQTPAVVVSTPPPQRAPTPGGGLGPGTGPVGGGGGSQPPRGRP